ncbi:MAG TPA: flagellar hook basal-body protein [Terriglobales bacterium]|nr:flagellar hook basal-body protein [Terriglobales bacterium]
MDSGFYAACTGLLAQTQALDLVSENLANVSTSAYKARQASFHTFLAQANIEPASLLSHAVNDYSILGNTSQSWLQGNLERTGNDLDVALQGPGLFAIQTTSGVRYTRNGNFKVSAKGQLVTANGDIVLGQNGPIPITSGKVSISTDGSVSINGALSGKLRIVDIPPQDLVQENAGVYASKANAKPSTGTQVQQGMLEGSNINAVQASVQLITVQRHAEMLQRALSEFHSEFNRIAANDLPRL